MISSADLKGVMTMMPSFATPDAVDIRATETVAVDELQRAVDSMIRDGANVISTTGTYGECYNLLFDEFKTLAAATVEAANKRVPIFIGTTSPNPREVAQKMRFVREIGADGVLLGVPYYVPSTAANALRFYQEIGGMFPDLGIMIYHNPENHKFTFPVALFQELVKIPSIVGMKDSHRSTTAFMNLQRIIEGKISVFVNQTQLHPYFQLGAAGCWSTEAWMGPWPVLHLWNVVKSGNFAEAHEIIMEMTAGGGEAGPNAPEGYKRPQEFASYCNPGPSRVPFLHFSDAVIERAQKRAAHWEKLCAKYRPLVEKERGVLTRA